MPVPPLDVSNLEIVGYADVLSPRALPSIVPPIFRRKDAVDLVLVPPYSFNGRYLCDATEISVDELETLKHRQEVTLFDDPIDARKEYELWVDPKGQRQYQTRAEARRRLDEIASQALKEALRAFDDFQLDEAEEYSSVALLANEKSLEAIALKIAIAKVKNDSASEEILREVVAPQSLSVISSRSKELSEQYYRAVPLTVNAVGRSIMYGVATIRSRP